MNDPLYPRISKLTFNDASSFLNALAPYNKVLPKYGSHFGFRGQGSSTFKLEPSSFRKGVLGEFGHLIESEYSCITEQNSNVNQAFAEAMILRWFIRYADRDGLSLPIDTIGSIRILDRFLHKCRNTQRHGEFADDDMGVVKVDWPIEELIPIMAIAQHYGLPTRLLDWTRNSFVAAYFASKDAIENNSTILSVWGLNLYEGLLGGSDGVIFQANGYKLRMISVAGSPNQNLTRQDGFFTLLEYEKSPPSSPIDDTSIEKLLGEGADVKSPFLYVLNIETNHAPEIMWFLERMGITSANLFPGFYGVTQAVRDIRHIKAPIF